MRVLLIVTNKFSVEMNRRTLITVCACSLLQPSLLLGHVIVSGDFTVTSIMTVVLCPATASALRGNTVLTELSLRDCHIDAEGTSHLAQALCDITTLKELDLSGNTVDSQGAGHLGKLSSVGSGAMGSLVMSDCVSVLHPTGRCLLSKMCPRVFLYLLVNDQTHCVS